MLVIWLQVEFNLMVGDMPWLMWEYPQVEENIQGVWKSWMHWIFRVAKGSIILVIAHVKSLGKSMVLCLLGTDLFCISASQSVLGRAAALASLKTYEEADSQGPYQVHWCRDPHVGSQWTVLSIISTVPWCIERKIWDSLCCAVLPWLTMAETCRKFLFGRGWWNVWHETPKKLLK